MSYSYNTNKKLKYINYNNETQSKTYIIELILCNKKNKHNIIHCIKKSNQGNLLSYEDNIKYNTITEYRLTILDEDFPDKPIIINDKIKNNSSYTFLNDEIFLEFNSIKNNLLNINYNINL